MNTENLYASEWDCRDLIERDIKPDTDKLYFRVDYDSTGTHEEDSYIVVDPVAAQALRDTPGVVGYFMYYSPVYTKDYAEAARQAVNRWEEVHEEFNNIRSSDAQYEDPMVWQVDEVLAGYVEKNVSDDYIKYLF